MTDLHQALQQGLTLCRMLQRGGPQDLTAEHVGAWVWLLKPYELEPGDLQSAFQRHLEGSPYFPTPSEILRFCQEAALERLERNRVLGRVLVTEADSGCLTEPLEEVRRRMAELFGDSEGFERRLGQLSENPGEFDPAPRPSEPTRACEILGGKA